MKDKKGKLINNHVKHVPATISPLPRHATLHTDCAGSVMVQTLSPASQTRTVESSPHVTKQESLSEGLTHILKYNMRMVDHTYTEVLV